MATSVSVLSTASREGAEGWNRYNATVLAICILGWAFDVYEQTVLQVITPILLKEFGMSLAEMGTLAIMVGGAAADFEAARPALAAMGTNVIHVGAVFHHRSVCHIL